MCDQAALQGTGEQSHFQEEKNIMKINKVVKYIDDKSN